jgi:diaminopropionate ammonia-lyase
MRVVLNPCASRDPYSVRETLVISRAHAEAARSEISRWPEYAITPLQSLSALAERLGIGALFYKDESNRLGQGSFKTLGGAYAATLKLRKLDSNKPVTLCCATDGNHGRSVAFAAQRHGCACVVFMHQHAPDLKEVAIASLGARVIRVAGNYDDSVRHARKTAEEQGWVLVADTSEDALDLTTRHVIQGYGVMVLEVIEQLEKYGLPSHIFVQAGVGGFAAAVAGVFADTYGVNRPRIIVVEPEGAACLLESGLHGAPSKVNGDLRTVMEMLSAGEASHVAWPVLRARADAFIAIDDARALETVCELSSSSQDVPLNVGVSGAAGVAGLIEVLKHAEVASILGLRGNSRVLVFGTEQGTGTTPIMEPAEGATRRDGQSA